MRGLSLVVALIIGLASGTIVMQPNQALLYATTPRLSILGSGFPSDVRSLVLELSVPGQPNLVAFTDYTVFKDPENDGVILELRAGRRWAPAQALKGRPLPLYLNKVYQKYFTPNRTAEALSHHGSSRFLQFPATSTKGENHTISLLREPVIVANVIAMPKVSVSSRPIYATATPELRINGSGLIGAREVHVEFNPPLKEQEDYELTSALPLTEDCFSVHLVKGKRWRTYPGELFLAKVDTGGGKVVLNGTQGILVANVKADDTENSGLHRLWVSDTSSTQLVYHDESSLIISGTGFNPHNPPGTLLRFSNGLTPADYTTMITTDTQIALRLRYGHYWYSDLSALPAVLTVSSVDIGDGFVQMGHSFSGMGKDVATVYERPAVYSSSKEIHKTKSSTLTIAGTGFAGSGSDINLIFSPVLRKGLDYTISMVGRNSMQLTLKEGRSWVPAAPGKLYVTAINTRGDPEGWVVLPGDGVLVAAVVSDSVVITNNGADAAQALGISTEQLYIILGVLGGLAVCCPCLALVVYMLYTHCCQKPDPRDFIRNSMDVSQRGLGSSHGGSVGSIHLSPLSAAAHYDPLSQRSVRGGPAPSRRLPMSVSGPGDAKDYDEDDLDGGDDVVFHRTGV